MLIELWERFRGYDKWIETTAFFENADVQKAQHVDKNGNVSYTYASLDKIVWVDKFGTKHSAKFRVPDDSPLYQMIDGDTAIIRYDPRQPECFYYRDLLETRIHSVFKITLWTISAISFFAVYIFIRSKYLQ